MAEMDESLGSGGLVKKKSSSGCLIIKKKGEFSGSGAGPSKSSRMTTGSGDESLEHARRDFNDKVTIEPIVYSRRAQESSERKRSRLDLFEFDEYDEFDMKRMKNDYMEMVRRSGSAREFGSGSRAVMVEKRKRAYFDGLVSGTSGRTKADNGQRSYDSDSDEANLTLSALVLKNEQSAGAIRLQGKSGVLKVMVNKNKKKKKDTPSVRKFDYQQVENRKQFVSEHNIKKKISVSSPGSSDSEGSEEKVEMLKEEESSMKRRQLKLGKHKKSEKLDKSKKAATSRSDWTERSSKLTPPILPGSGSMKAIKKEEKRPLPENVTPVKVKERNLAGTAGEKAPKEGREDKSKRGCSTEKQLLREKIREMLIKAGWKIDYRPRRDRDYHDSVYINPSGTAYWSIIKAYDAFQKQMPEVDDLNKPEGESSSFVPLSDDLLKKLTRKTRKKMEEEMKKNSAGKKGGSSVVKKSKKAVPEVSNKVSDDDDNEMKERPNSFVRQNGNAKKFKLHEEDSDCRHDLSDDSSDEKREAGNSRGPSTSYGAAQARKTKKFGRCTLLARNSEEGQNLESDGFISYAGKRTLLAWLIDSETVQLSEKVQYLNRRKARVKLEGWITREGIHCSCCSKILTVSKFELHAGSKLRQPLQNIVLVSGPSLLECLIDAWNKQDKSRRQDFHAVDVDGGDPDDDTCGICADGGDLICCDGCPSTFHQSCLGIKMLPPGDWHCPNCTCKYCGTVQIVPVDSVSASEILTCTLCEKKYHNSCSKGEDALALGTNDSPSPYCGKNCQEIHDYLQKILGLKHELQGGFTWSILHRTDLNSDTESRGYPQRVECNSKLAVALSVMDECFLPIFDRRSGINQILNVVYNCGSNFNRLNYRGFYTAVLERGDEIISAASIRLRGTQLAEMPFIGTRNTYRRQGLCRQLLSAIESVLCSLKIEKLVIPAISEHIQTWTGVFGFKPLENSHRKEMKFLNLLVFPGVDMLQKPLVKQELSENVEGIVSNESSPQSHNLLEAHDTDSSREESKVQVDIASDGTSVEPQTLESKCQSPTAASAGSFQLGTSSPHHPVRDDSQSSAKDLGGDDPYQFFLSKTWLRRSMMKTSAVSTDCNHIGGSFVPCQDVEKSSVNDAKSELPGPSDASHDVGDMSIESRGYSSLKLSNRQVHEAEEDSAAAEQAEEDSAAIEQDGEDGAASEQAEEDSAASEQAEEDSAASEQAEEDSAASEQAEEDSAASEQAEEDSAASEQAEEDSAASEQAEEDSAAVEQAEEDSAASEQAEEDSAASEQAEEDSAASEQAEEDSAAVEQAEKDSAAVEQAEEDSAAIEHINRFSVEASYSNGVEQATMEFPSVSSPSKNSNNLAQLSSDFNQDNANDAEAGDDVDDSGRSNRDSDCLPKEASTPNLAEDLKNDVDPSYDSNATVEKTADVTNQLSAPSDADTRFDFFAPMDSTVEWSISEDSLVVIDKVTTSEHTLDSSARHSNVEKTEGAQNEGDTKLSSIEVVGSVDSENVSGEAVAADVISQVDSK